MCDTLPLRAYTHMTRIPTMKHSLLEPLLGVTLAIILTLAYGIAMFRNDAIARTGDTSTFTQDLDEIMHEDACVHIHNDIVVDFLPCARYTIDSIALRDYVEYLMNTENSSQFVVPDHGCATRPVFELRHEYGIEVDEYCRGKTDNGHFGLFTQLEFCDVSPSNPAVYTPEFGDTLISRSEVCLNWLPVVHTSSEWYLDLTNEV